MLTTSETQDVEEVLEQQIEDCTKRLMAAFEKFSRAQTEAKALDVTGYVLIASLMGMLAGTVGARHDLTLQQQEQLSDKLTELVNATIGGQADEYLLPAT